MAPPFSRRAGGAPWKGSAESPDCYGGEETIMKEGIHPEYKETTISCVCGNIIHTRSTRKDIKVEICSKCHPFMTGKQKIVDTAGRVERFKKKYAGQEKEKKA